MSIFSTVALITSADTGVPAVTAGKVLNNALDIVYFLAGVIAVIVIIYAGIRFVTGSGNEKNITQAKSIILYAVIGLVVIISAFTVTWFVLGRFQ